MAIRDMYNRFKAEIEREKGITVGKLELVDNSGAVTLKVTPATNVLDLSFTEAGTVPTTGGTTNPGDVVTTPPADDVVTVPTDDGSGIVIIWGEEPTPVGTDEVVVLSLNAFNVYRSVDGNLFTRIATNVTLGKYTDTPLVKGKTYFYYIVPVDVNGNEGVPSSVSKITL